jgi:CRISPR/Cas system-associated protein endoribonuclease Cas2
MPKNEIIVTTKSKTKTHNIKTMEPVDTEIPLVIINDKALQHLRLLLGRYKI